MKCNNCGARLADNAKVCQNCGAFIDDKDGYVLLTSDDKMLDVSSSYDKPKKKNGFIRFLSIVLTLAIIGGGAYYYFTNIYDPSPNKPSLNFKTGSGIINDDEKIIYVLLSEDSSIEYIHGVSLYDYDKTDKKAEKKDPVLKNYEYTKSIDSTFRAIFFDVQDLELSEESNTYTFEMKFSFNDSADIFTYIQPITFSSDISEDVSDLIFDHSQIEETTLAIEKTTEAATEETTTKAPETTAASTTDYGFIYNSYWYTEPIENGEEYIISALKFNKDNTYVSTNYYKNGTENWKVTTYKGKYQIKDGYVVVDNGEATESTYYKIDTANNSLFEEGEDNEALSTLTSRKYNSIKNAEDFFGI